MRAGDFLTELADRAYRWALTKRSPGLDIYVFRSESDQLYQVTIKKLYSPPPSPGLAHLVVGFAFLHGETGNWSMERTGAGNALRVFATVRDIVSSYVTNEKPPASITFSAAIEDRGRVRFYQRIADSSGRWFPGYSLANKSSDDVEVTWTLKRQISDAG